jgi:hypothetical protein
MSARGVFPAFIDTKGLGGNPLNPDEQNTLCADCHTGKGYHAK